MRTNNHQYTSEDIQLSKNYLLKLFQDNFFHSAVNSLQRGIKLNSKFNIRCLNSLYERLTQILLSIAVCTKTNGLGKTSNHFARHGQNCSFLFGTWPSNMFSPVHGTNKSLHSTTLPCDWPSESVSKHTISLFLMSTL